MMVACGDGVVVLAAHNAMDVDGAAATNNAVATDDVMIVNDVAVVDVGPVTAFDV